MEAPPPPGRDPRGGWERERVEPLGREGARCVSARETAPRGEGEWTRDCGEGVWNETLSGQMLYIYAERTIGPRWVV